MCSAGVDNLDVSRTMCPDLRERYLAWYEALAKRNLEYVRRGTVREQFHYKEEPGVWHLPTQVQTYPALLRSVQRLFPRRDFDLGLDVGCGTVTFFDFLRVSRPVLVDIVEDYCEFMRQRWDEVVRADVEKLLFADEVADVVVCSDVLEHVLSFNAVKAELGRVLKCDGLLLVNVPWEQSLEGKSLDDFGHVRTFNEGNLARRFVGWRVLDKEVLTNPYGWLTTVNLVLEKAL